VKEVYALSGPALLQQAAIDAVKTWIFRPDLRNGVAVEMESTVDVDFPWHR
jgi:protein TonB